ncbi:hypothetical protein ACTWPT_32255 [Nonomuraea sp. 3N208]|uniref:hypothetical protein n=1 Tax=Nonomuraea sp. 3N208 TaxID=3457421 RepID=UPI003FCF3B24
MDYEWGVSVVTLGELRLGVLQARDAETSARRLSAHQLAGRFEPMVIVTQDSAYDEMPGLDVIKL